MLCESVSSVLIVFYNKYMESMLGLSRRLEFHILKLISTYAFFLRIVILVSSLFFIATSEIDLTSFCPTPVLLASCNEKYFRVTSFTEFRDVTVPKFGKNFGIRIFEFLILVSLEMFQCASSRPHNLSGRSSTSIRCSGH